MMKRMDVKMGKRVKEYVEEKLGRTDISHKETYETLVNDIGIDYLVTLLPVTSKSLLTSYYKEDEHFNNIPLKKWDDKASSARYAMATIGITTTSLSECVSLLKNCAKMYVKSN